jgi:hypothetical protein
LHFEELRLDVFFYSCCASLDVFKFAEQVCAKYGMPKIRYKYALGIVYLSSIVHIIDVISWIVYLLVYVYQLCFGLNYQGPSMLVE